MIKKKNHAKRLAITYVNFLKRKIIDGRQAFNLGEDKNELDLRFLWLTLPKETSKEFQTTFLEAPLTRRAAAVPPSPALYLPGIGKEADA